MAHSTSTLTEQSAALLAISTKSLATNFALACCFLPSSVNADGENPSNWTLYPPERADSLLIDQSQAIVAHHSCQVDLRNAERAIAYELIGVSYVVTILADPVWSDLDGAVCSLTAKRTVDYDERSRIELIQDYNVTEKSQELFELGDLLQDWVIHDPCDAALIAHAATAETLAYYEYTIEIEALPNADDPQSKGCRVSTMRSVTIENE